MRSWVPAALVAVLTLAACGGEETAESQLPAETPQSAEEAPEEAPMPFTLTAEQAQGKVVYETMCWSCHGSAGRGDGPAVQAGAIAPPPDFTSGISGAAVRRLRASFEAEAGSQDPNRPHMANVMSIIDADAFGEALDYLPALAYPPELPGSAIAGRGIYLLRCQTCHGPTGHGDGPGAQVLDLAPADFTQDTLLAARNFQGAFDRIRNGGGGVHGSAMPAWGVMFNEGDVWDLVSYISTFQPGVLSAPPTEGR